MDTEVWWKKCEMENTWKKNVRILGNSSENK